MSENTKPKQNEEQPGEETDEEKAKKTAVKAGTELTYQQFEDQLTKNTAQVMDACKAAIAEGFKPLEAKIDEKVKLAVAALLPKVAVKPTGKGVIAAPDDAQKLNNMFAKKADLHKAGLELKAAAHRMNGLTADMTHEEEEEEA